ncbi:MAG: BrnA antitoxin of type toxin-antitoxin system [Pseudomonadota bacterium]|jgi:hypothetical protein
MPKTLISIRIDDDILSWFREVAPDGYQTRISEVLRDFKERHEERLQRVTGRAQQIFVERHGECFWHLRKDLEVTPAMLPVIRAGLRRHGGWEGGQLANELELGPGWDALESPGRGL